MEGANVQGRAQIERIGVIGNYIPRQCGIAIFMADLCGGITSSAVDAIRAVEARWGK